MSAAFLPQTYGQTNLASAGIKSEDPEGNKNCCILTSSNTIAVLQGLYIVLRKKDR